MDQSLICSPKEVDPYGELKIFAGSGSRRLAESICRKIGVPVAQSETKIFSEGNIFVRVLENVPQTGQRHAGHGRDPLFQLCQGR